MPLPGNFQTITVNGSYVDLSGAAPSGSIQFDIEPTVTALADPTADTVILPKSITASITAGTFSVTLPASNDPDIVPSFNYKVTENFPTLGLTRTYFVSIPYNAASPLNIADITPLTTSSGTGIAAISVQDEGTTTSSSVQILNFTGSGVTASGTSSTATINIPGGGGSSVTIKDEGTNITTAPVSLDFVGAGVTATQASNAVTVTVPGGGTTFTVQDEGSTTSSTVNTLNFTGTGVTASGSGATATVTISTLVTVNSQAGTTYTLALSDLNKAVEFTSTGAVTVTVPPNSSVAFPVGSVIEIARMGTGSVTIAQGSGVTIRTPSTLVLRAQYSTVSLRKRATDEWVLAGDTT